MNPAEFFRLHPVFRFEQFVAACYPAGSPDSRAPERALRHHQRVGRISRLRRGLYTAAADPGIAPDSYLIASQLAPDAVLAYHTALEYLGLAHSLWSERQIVSRHAVRDLDHDGVRYRALAVPAALDTADKQLVGLCTRQVQGLTIRHTSLERTLVDLLDRPELAGGWEELRRSLDNVGFIDAAEVVRYVLLLNNRTTAARVGWFIESHRGEWMVPEEALLELEAMAPRQPTYIDRARRRGGILQPRWNLLVPESLLAREWAEVT